MIFPWEYSGYIVEMVLYGGYIVDYMVYGGYIHIYILDIDYIDIDRVLQNVLNPASNL